MAATADKAVSLDMGKNSSRCALFVRSSVMSRKIGYWELAQEIDHVLPATRTITGDDVAVLPTDAYVQKKGTELKGERLSGLTLLDATNKDLLLDLTREFGLSGRERGREAARERPPCRDERSLQGWCR